MANSDIVMCARLLLTICTEGVAIFYFILSEQEGFKLEPNSTNPLYLNICYVQPLYFTVTLLAYCIFVCFDKLEETQQGKKHTVRDQFRHIRRLVNFMVTFPLFSWFGV
jgi:hypothetical protein